MKSDLTYLACPYSHPDSLVRHYRFQMANRAAAYLMSQGKVVYSPISHSAPIATEGGMAFGWETWSKTDLTMLALCGDVVLLKLDDWEKSEGIKGELKKADDMGLAVSDLDPAEVMAWYNALSTTEERREERSIIKDGEETQRTIG